jgi:hypothetical protein
MATGLVSRVGRWTLLLAAPPAAGVGTFAAILYLASSVIRESAPGWNSWSLDNHVWPLVFVATLVLFHVSAIVPVVIYRVVRRSPTPFPLAPLVATGAAASMIIGLATDEFHAPLEDIVSTWLTPFPVLGIPLLTQLLVARAAGARITRPLHNERCT